MGQSKVWVRRHIASMLIALLATPLAGVAAAPMRQPLPNQQQASQQQPERTVPDNAQDAKGQAKKITAEVNQSTNTDADIQGTPAVTPSQTSEPGSQQSNSTQQPNENPNPLGTAAAPNEKTTGVAASKPAGAVIAPGKQKRARSLVIRVGVILAAVVAVGTVAALSHGSSGRP